MDESDTNTTKTCTMQATDSKEHTNLCCCYIMNEDGKLDDPCYHPADECC